MSVQRHGGSRSAGGGLRGLLSSATNFLSNRGNQRAIRGSLGVVKSHLKRKRGNAGTSFTRKRARSVPETTVSRSFTHAASDRAAAKGVKFKKAVHYKRVPKVHVDKKFRAKVTKALAPKKYHGFYHAVNYGIVTNTVANSQNFLEPNMDGIAEYQFSPNQVLNAASILWNGKGAPLSPLITDPNNFDPKQTKVFVKKAWTVMQVKNNTQRVAYLKMFNCRPKSDQNASLASGQWTTTLAEMNGSGAGGLFSENPLNTTPLTIHADPRGLKQWDKWFVAEVTKFVIAPGQTIDYTVRGPEGVDYDFSKFYNGTTYQQIQKCMRCVFGVFYFDLTAASLSGALRPGEGSTAASGGLTWEANAYYMLEMPEKAGSIGVGTAGVGTPLQERHNAYSINVSDPGVVGGGVRVDEENPALTTFI